MAQSSPTWNYTLNNPEKAGLAVGVVGAAAAVPAAAGIAGVATIQSGVGAAYVGKMVLGGALYEHVAKNTLDSLPGMVQAYSKFNAKDRSTWASAAKNTVLMYGPNALGDKVGAGYDIFDSLKNIGNDIRSTVKGNGGTSKNNKNK